MAQYLDPIRVGSTALLGLHGEVFVYDTREGRCLDRASLDGEQIVTERHVISSLGSVPFADRGLLLPFNSSGFQMTLVVDKVAVSHGRIAL